MNSESLNQVDSASGAQQSIEVGYARRLVAGIEICIVAVAALFLNLFHGVVGAVDWFGRLVLWFVIAGTAYNVIYRMIRSSRAGPAIMLGTEGLHSTPWLGTPAFLRWKDIETIALARVGRRGARHVLRIGLASPHACERDSELPSTDPRCQVDIHVDELQVAPDQLLAMIKSRARPASH